MRNGNEIQFQLGYKGILGSYRTYEEWKLLPNLPVEKLFGGFLPYLWGMETFPVLVGGNTFFSSYRTYEEWKLPKEAAATSM